MSEWRVGSSWNLEAHRLKNRLRQQRYRARKREERARRDAEIPVLAEMSISSLPSISNGNSAPWHDDITPLSPSNTEAKYNGTSSATDELREFDSSDQNVNSPIENGSFQVRCIVRPEDQQRYAELLQSQAERSSLTYLEGDQISDSSKIQNPQFLMEQAYHLTNMNENYIHTTVTPSERENGGSNSNIMARRLKNRERQRRYRARKRLEADMKKASLLNQNQSELLPLQTQPNSVTSIARVHCCRNWKEDARRANPTQQAEEKSSEEEDQPQISLQQVNAETECEEDGVQIGSVLANETQVGRRDWKMDARNKVV